MINCAFRIDDEDGGTTTIAHGEMPHAPREGEHVWLEAVGQSRHRRYCVINVAYWVNARWTKPARCGAAPSCLGADVSVVPVPDDDDDAAPPEQHAAGRLPVDAG